MAMNINNIKLPNIYIFLLSWYLTEFVSVVINTNRRNIETLDVEMMSYVTLKISDYIVGLEHDGKFPPYPCNIILSSDV